MLKCFIYFFKYMYITTNIKAIYLTVMNEVSPNIMYPIPRPGQSLYILYGCVTTLQWRHNDHDCVSNHQPRGCLLSRLFRRRSKKTSKLRVTGLCVGNSPGPVNSPHKGPVTRKMFPFDDVIMIYQGEYQWFRNIQLYDSMIQFHIMLGYRCVFLSYASFLSM